MKNIQEILLKCGGVGKLKLGNEEIDVFVSGTKTELHRMDGYVNAERERIPGEQICITSLDVLLCGDDFGKLGD